MTPADKEKLVKRFCKALDQDPRVIKIERPVINVQFSPRLGFYPYETDNDSDDMLTGADYFRAISLSDPILFELQIPTKNQPKHHGTDDVPAEKYWVSWDGITAFVLWEQNTDNVPTSGGHVVTDVLSDALESIGDELHIQPCKPQCDNIFFHTPMHIVLQSGEDPSAELTVKDHPQEPGVDVLIFGADDNFEILQELNFGLGLTVQQFAEMKNAGQRVMDIESSLRAQLAHLLGHYYDQAILAAQPIWKTTRKRWRNKGWRREARQLLAGLWLSLANLELMERRWHDEQAQFTDRASEHGKMALFTVDYRNNAETIKGLDVTHLESTINQVAQRLDTRAIVVATAGGAVAGGLAGGIVGLLIALIH